MEFCNRVSLSRTNGEYPLLFKRRRFTSADSVMSHVASWLIDGVIVDDSGDDFAYLPISEQVNRLK